MVSIKINPPTKLPEQGVTELIFNVWREKLDIYLAQDDRWSIFMTGGPYATWGSYEVNLDRITEPAGADRKAQLPMRRRELSAFLSIVAKACSEKHYTFIMQQSTSLQSIFSKLCSDYGMGEKEIHFFDLFDLKFQPEIDVIDFYHQYRNLVIANLKKQGDIIVWQNSRVLEVDEELSPTFEELILANVLLLLDTRLPGHVRDNYQHLVGRKRSLMDHKNDILVKVPAFIIQTEDHDPALPLISNVEGSNR